MIKNDTIKNPTRDIYIRLKNFGFDRSHIKKLTMTIPYNSTHISQVRYLRDSLFIVDNDALLSNYTREEFNEILSKQLPILWFSKTEDLKEGTTYVCNKDLHELVKLIFSIIAFPPGAEFTKIKKLNAYLKQVAKICSMLNVPIT